MGVGVQMKFETFGDRLKTLRLEKGWLIKELSDRSRISRTTVGQYERGELHPGYWNLLELAKVLDAPLDYLCGVV